MSEANAMNEITEALGLVFLSGDAAPADGVFQLVGDDPNATDRADFGRVFRFKQGETLPNHPDTDAAAEWRFVRLTAGWREMQVLT
ncbi:MAG: hypothetical protein GYB65_07565 [Chloroflexi bacterium]|nr:hypothetical protein [Chloroflexota bacterium]